MQIFGGGCLLLDNFHPAGHGHGILESFALPRRRILAPLRYHVSYRKCYVDYADDILKKIIRSLNSNYDGCLDIGHQFLVFVLLLAREISKRVVCFFPCFRLLLVRGA